VMNSSVRTDRNQSSPSILPVPDSSPPKPLTAL